MRKNQQLVIVLPESSEELPIRIVRGSRSMELRLRLCPPDGEERHVNETCPERKYVFIWRQNDYLKTAVDEIQWIEAAGSYSRILNLRHVETLVGNSLKIGNELLAIGDATKVDNSTCPWGLAAGLMNSELGPDFGWHW